MQTLDWTANLNRFPSGEIADATEEILAEDREITGTNLDGAWSIDWTDCYSTGSKFFCSITRQGPASYFDTLMNSAYNVITYTDYEDNDYY